MEVKKMLFVTDFGDLWFNALQSLMELRKAGLGHVVLAHVIDRGIGYYTKEEEERLRGMAEVRFLDWAESLFETGMECGAYISVGSTAPKILATVEEERVNLIVTGCHKRAKLEKFYLDSKTLELLRKTTVPVLVHKYTTKSGKVNDKPFQKPLLATDWSPPAARALEFLIGLKNIMEKVEIIHVIPEKAMVGLGKSGLARIKRDNKNRLEELCDTLEDEGIEAESHLYIGDVTTQIENAAREREATLIATGTSGKGAWQARWLGSVSQRLAEVSELPSLLVP